MAKETAKPMTTAKSRKATKPRTDSELLGGGLKDKLFYLVRAAYGLAGGLKDYKSNGFKGISSLESSKLPSAVFQRAAHVDSPYWKLSDSDARLKQFRDKIASAQNDIAAGKYTGSVQNAVQDFLNIKSEYATRGGGGGGKKLNASLISSVKI
jgi:hypothetical protein